MMSLIHPSAVIEDGAVLGLNVSVGPFVYIGSKVKMGIYEVISLEFQQRYKALENLFIKNSLILSKSW